MRIDFAALYRRYPFRAGCVVVTIVMAIASVGLNTKLSELEKIHYVRSREGESVLVMLVAGPSLRQEMALTRATVKRIEDHLVNEDNLTDNLAYFYRIEEQTKVKLAELRQLPAATADTGSLFKPIPFSLRATGTYAQVASFTQSVETGPRLSEVTNFSFRRPANPADMMTLEMRVSLLGKK